MRLSPVMFMQRDDMKSLHDNLVRAWEDQDGAAFDAALDLLRKEVVTIPRKKYGKHSVYTNDGHQPARVVLIDPSTEDIECID